MKQYLTASTREDAISKREFFCSELIATAYIIMELLSEKVSPSQYFPVHFSKDKTLDWQKGAYLGNEYLVNIS